MAEHGGGCSLSQAADRQHARHALVRWRRFSIGIGDHLARHQRIFSSPRCHRDAVAWTVMVPNVWRHGARLPPRQPRPARSRRLRAMLQGVDRAVPIGDSHMIGFVEVAGRRSQRGRSHGPGSGRRWTGGDRGGNGHGASQGARISNLTIRQTRLWHRPQLSGAEAFRAGGARFDCPAQLLDLCCCRFGVHQRDVAAELPHPVTLLQGRRAGRYGAGRRGQPSGPRFRFSPGLKKPKKRGGAPPPPPKTPQASPCRAEHAPPMTLASRRSGSRYLWPRP